MNEDHTEIVIVLDRSGSMSAIKEDMEGGLAAFFEEQKKEPGRCTVTMTQFDTSYEILYSGLDLEEVPPPELVPRSMTALYDALGRTIDSVGARLAKTPKADRPGRVLFLIITDGKENASVEYTGERVREMVEHQTDKYGWKFVYLGANQDAVLAGARMGIATAKDYQATRQGTRRLYQDVSRSVGSFRGGQGYT